MVGEFLIRLLQTLSLTTWRTFEIVGEEQGRCQTLAASSSLRAQGLEARDLI